MSAPRLPDHWPMKDPPTLLYDAAYGGPDPDPSDYEVPWELRGDE